MSLVYPNSCEVCSSPARKIDRVMLCSNLKCKGRKKVIRSFGVSNGMFELEEGLTKETAIKIACSTCNAAAAATARPRAAYCYTCRQHFSYAYEVNKFYASYDRKSAYQFVGADRGWWIYVGSIAND